MAVETDTTVLVVDDDELMQKFYLAALRREPYQVLVASNGEVALETIMTESIDCLVIDSAMPVMRGTEVVERLRAMPQFALLPIIIVTGSDELIDRVKGLNLGANDYMVKPVDPSELVARIRAQLRTNSNWFSAARSLLEQRIALIDALNQLDHNAQLADRANAIVQRLVGLDGVQQVAIYGFTRPDVSILLAGESGHSVGHQREVPKGVTSKLRDMAERGPSILSSGVDEMWWSKLNSDRVYAAPIRDDQGLLAVLVLTVDGRISSESFGMSLSIDSANIVATLLGKELRALVGKEFTADEIREAVRDPDSYIAYQPILDLRNRTTAGFEALARFADQVPPDHRLSHARSVGIIDEIELELFELAVNESSGLADDAWLSINLSAATLVAHPELSLITGNTNRKLVIEVTEHEPVTNYAMVRAAISQLKGEPLLSVDDAGAGYASLRHIFELSPSFVKLDREWVAGLDGDPIRQSLVDALVTFSQRSGAMLIAEGIETVDELRTLIDVGVNLGQGYLLGRPIHSPGEDHALIISRLETVLNELR